MSDQEDNWSEQEAWEDVRGDARDDGQDDEDAWEDVDNDGEMWEDVEDDEEAWEDVQERDSEAWEDLQEEKKEPEIDYEALNQALNAALEPPKKKTKVKRLTKKEKQELTVQKKALLMCILARESYVNTLANDTLLQCLMRSLLPTDIESLLANHRQQSSKKDLVYLVQHLLKWFRLTFTRLPYVPAATCNMTASSLQTVFYERAGVEHELVCIFTALCRGCNIPTRYIVVLDAPNILRRYEAFEPFFGIDAEETSGAMSNSSSLRSWNELYHGEWLHVDACRNLIDQPFQVEKLRGRGALMPFVVAFDGNGTTIDVAKSYATIWPKTQALRASLDQDWYSQLLRVGQSNESPIEIDVKAPMPTNAEQFKNHPQYCLEKQLGVFQHLYPRKAVGLFKGIPVFSRKHVHTLRSKHQWRRKGRIVQENEEPIKRITRKQKKNVFPPRLDNTLGLYGEWQTIVYQPPEVIDGVIPKNEHGNIEIWTSNDVPIGAVHIRLVRVQRVAKELGIDYAPAVVGWEVKGGRNVPVVDGIVVAEHFETMIRDAHATMEQDLIEKAIKRNRQLIIKRWSLVVQKLLLRKRLHDEYSTGQ